MPVVEGVGCSVLLANRISTSKCDLYALKIIDVNAFITTTCLHTNGTNTIKSNYYMYTYLSVE